MYVFKLTDRNDPYHSYFTNDDFILVMGRLTEIIYENFRESGIKS